MEDLIKRKDAIKAEADRVYKVLRSEGCKETYEDCLADAEKTFKDIPSAENKGEWMFVGNSIESMWECSKCGEKEFGSKSELTNFCPNCGAHMKGADDDNP